MPLLRTSLSTLLFIAIIGCGNIDQADINDSSSLGIEEVDIINQYEESVPDSGLLDDVNPEEIITDDWSDEGDLELDTEE